MAAAAAEYEPRLFAVPKKRRRKPPAPVQPDAAKSAVRSVSSAQQHAEPTPVGLSSSPSTRAENANGGAQQRAPAVAIDHTSTCREHSEDDDNEAAAAAADALPNGDDAAAAEAAAGGKAEDGDKAPLQLPVADTTFRALGISEWLDRVCRSLGMTKPTQVQAGCIPAILAGRNAISTAHTGSGKTAAFTLPILQLLAADPFGVFALVLTPTRWVLLAGRPALTALQSQFHVCTQQLHLEEHGTKR